MSGRSGWSRYPKKTDPFYLTPAWREVRRLALERDMYLCQRCMKLQEHGLLPYAHPHRATMVHHIRPIKEAPWLALTMDNLVSLCDECHNKLHPERGYKRQATENRFGQRVIVIGKEAGEDEERSAGGAPYGESAERSKP